MRRSRRMRLPNGFGAIVQLKGNLRNPYLAKRRVGSDKYDRPLYLTIGTYPTYSEAFEALLEANKLALPPEAGISFSELYNRFREEMLTLPTNGKTLSSSSIEGYRFAFQAVAGLHKKRFLKITAPELQQALENAGGSASKQEKIKLLYSKLYHYADYLGLTDRDLSTFVRITKKDNPKRNPFTSEEVYRIWEMPPCPYRDSTLVMLYTGLRIGELFTVHDIGPEYFRAGLKTDAGINRVVPIHPEIADLIPGLFPMSGTPNLAQRWFRKNIPGHTPHDCRRTFITRADECGMNPTACRQIVGHASGDVHTAKYTLHSPAYLCEEIKKLKY